VKKKILPVASDGRTSSVMKKMMLLLALVASGCGGSEFDPKQQDGCTCSDGYVAVPLPEGNGSTRGAVTSCECQPLDRDH
jgi:hypothetical protein